MRLIRTYVFGFLFACFLIIGCSTNEQYDMDEFYRMYGTNSENIESLFEVVSKQKIFFGHQSVGFNIISGIEQWEKEIGIQINMIESRKVSDPDSFVHFRVGENNYPYSKIDDFVTLAKDLPSEQNWIAFFKFCYVDFHESTDVDEVFNYYKESMLDIKERYPQCRFVLVTVPMTGIQKGLKGTAKRILNRAPYGALENIKRNEFNEKVLNELRGEFAIFDLAGIETTLPDGSPNTYQYKGGEYPCIPDFYTTDLGHLNDYGAKMVAYNLVAFLAEELK